MRMPLPSLEPGGDEMTQVIFCLAFVIFAALGLQRIRLNDKRRAAEETERKRKEKVQRAFEMNRAYRWED